jgi:sodium/proline symporter
VGTDRLRMDQPTALIPFYLYELVPGFFLSLLSIFIFSKIGSTSSKEMIEEFDLVKTSHI